MKNVFLSVMLLLSVTSVVAQTIYTGNSTITSPRTVTLNSNYLRFQATSNFLYMLPSGALGSNFIGINTTTPTEALDINGNVKAKIGHFTNSLANGQIFPNSAHRGRNSQVLSAGTLLDATENYRTLNYWDFPSSNLDANPVVHLSIDDRAYKARFRFWAQQGGPSSFSLYDKTQTQNFYVNDDGSNNTILVMPKTNSFVGIGTSSFTDGTDTYHLSVNGNIRAERVKVYTTWADYVFEESYDLPTLEEVEMYIREKGHLKDIPSAAEVEEKGVELGEMNKLLLQKIEELTLYTIELNKQVKELKMQLNK